MAKSEEEKSIETLERERNEILELMDILQDLQQNFPSTYELMKSMLESHYSRVKVFGERK